MAKYGWRANIILNLANKLSSQDSFVSLLFWVVWQLKTANQQTNPDLKEMNLFGTEGEPATSTRLRWLALPGFPGEKLWTTRMSSWGKSHPRNWQSA
jgi:hypothetical protein